MKTLAVVLLAFRAAPALADPVLTAATAGAAPILAGAKAVLAASRSVSPGLREPAGRRVSLPRRQVPFPNPSVFGAHHLARRAEKTSVPRAAPFA